MLLDILPNNSTLIAELDIPSAAVGFVKPGQPVKLRYDAFPYQRYGIHEGEIVEISRSVLSGNSGMIPEVPVYRAKVRLGSQVVLAYGDEQDLLPGMTLTADVILEQRSLVRWLLDPLYSLQGRI